MTLFGYLVKSDEDPKRTKEDREAMGRSAVFLWTVAFLLACGAPILALKGTTQDKEFEIHRTIYVAIYGTDVGGWTHTTFRSSIIGITVLCFAGFVCLMSTAYWYSESVRDFLSKIGAASYKSQDDILQSQKGYLHALFWGTMAVVDVLAVWFFGITSGTREWTVLVTLSLCLFSASFFSYRIWFYIYSPGSSILFYISGLFSCVPWVVIITNATYFYEKVNHDRAEDGDAFDENNDYWRIKFATIFFATAMLARNCALNSGYVQIGRPFQKRVSLKETPYTQEDHYDIFTKPAIWLSGLWAMVVIFIGVMSEPDIEDDYPIWAPFTYVVGSHPMRAVKCEAWPANWLLFAAAVCQFLFYSAIAYKETWRRSIIGWVIAMSGAEMIWIIGPGLMNFAIYVVLAASAGSSDWQEFLPGGILLMATAGVLASATSPLNDKRFSWSRRFFNGLAIIMGCFPYAVAVGKSYATVNTLLDNHDSGESLRLLLTLSACFFAFNMLAKVIFPVKDNREIIRQELYMMLGSSFFQIGAVSTIILGKLLSPLSLAEKPCWVL